MSNTKEIFERVKAATVAIAIYDKTIALHKKETKRQPYEIIGTGFCIHPRGIVVSCRHVFQEFYPEKNRDFFEGKRKPDELKIIDAITPHAIFFDTKSRKDKLIAMPMPMDIMGISCDHDLGKMRLQPNQTFSRGYPFLKIAKYDELYEGMEAATCGFPEGNLQWDKVGDIKTMTSSFTKGILSSIIPMPNCSAELVQGFQIDYVTKGGNSGGPVFKLDSGEVFGVHTGSHPTAQYKMAQPIYPLLKNLEDFLKRPSDPF